MRRRTASAHAKTANDLGRREPCACRETKKSLKKSMSANEDAMKQLDKDIARLAEEIADHHKDLLVAEAQMKDDELYLKDLQKQCEDRANDYDQRSAMRGDELNALTQALDVLKGDVKGRADDVNKRAFIQEASVAPKTLPKNVAPTAAKASEK